MKAFVTLAAIGIALSGPAFAGTICRTNALGHTTCFDDGGNVSTIRTSPTGRTTITESDGTTTTGRVRESVMPRTSTFSTDQGDTYTSRRSLDGRSETITDPNGRTTTCRTSLLGTTTCN